MTGQNVTGQNVTRRVAAYLARDRRKALLLLGVALLMAVVSAAGPVLIAQGPGLGLESQAGAWALVAGVIAVGVVVWVINRVRVYLTRSLVADAVLAMRLDATRTALEQDLDFYDRTGRAAVTSRVTNDLESFGESTFGLLELLQQLLVVVLLVPLMFALEWRLTLATLAGGVVIALTTRRFGRVTRHRAGLAAAATAELTTTVNESTAGLATVRAFGCEQPLIDTTSAHNSRLYEANRRADLFAAMLQPALAVLTGLILAMLVLAGGLMVQTAVLTVAAWYLFVLATDRVAWLLASTGALDGQAQAALAAAGRVLDLIDTPVPARAGGSAASGGGLEQVSVRLDDVRLTYASGSRALRGVSLDIPAGCHVGLVGPSGSGKSTLLKVLARLHPASDGQVSLGGRALPGIPEAELRAAVAYVPQHPQLFAGTVAGNLRLASPARTDQELERLVDDAGLTPWLSTLPDGLRTEVGQAGSLLSHGQRQVVCLLRALAKQPRLVLLDEPTANVDNETDEHLQAALRSLLSGVTCVMIAHRLTTIRDLDLIAVLSEGRITESGTHDELLAAGGQYAALHQDFEYASPMIGGAR